MHKERIIKILTNHRQPHCPGHPKALTVRSIVSLVEHSLPPNRTVTSEEIWQSLQELQAEGEVLAGRRNHFCIAPPTILAEDESNLVEVLFRGDRAYLELAHRTLKTGQTVVQTRLRPKIHEFHRIKELLANCGIRMLTVTDRVSHLPTPEKPRLNLLCGAEYEDPFQCWSTSGLIQAYLPQSQWQKQRERWKSITKADLVSNSLLKLPTGEYLWFMENQFYELSPDTASLAMFWLDQQVRLPLQISWDQVSGRLNLQGIILPSSYAQWLWRLSEPDPDQPRIRLFDASKREDVCQALTRQLGCVLV